jgi:hypothetical protein
MVATGLAQPNILQTMLVFNLVLQELPFKMVSANHLLRAVQLEAISMLALIHAKAVIILALLAH